MAFGKNKWTEEELDVASKLLKKNLHLTKTWKDESYTVYNIPHENYPNRSNEILCTHDLSAVIALLEENNKMKIKDGIESNMGHGGSLGFSSKDAHEFGEFKLNDKLIIGRLERERDEAKNNYMDAANCLEDLIRIYQINIDEDGEPKESLMKMVDTWVRAREIVSKSKK